MFFNTLTIQIMVNCPMFTFAYTYNYKLYYALS